MNGLLVSDSVQGLLTNLCQDSSLDIVLRLQILEVGFYFESDAQFWEPIANLEENPSVTKATHMIC